MSILITVPVLPAGVSPDATTGWFSDSGTDPTEVYDGWFPGVDWQQIFEVCNGNLHASNFDMYTAYEPMKNSIPETKIAFRDFAGSGQDEYPFSEQLVSAGHSHDGYDSSFLGLGAVDRNVTRLRSFGGYMCPSTSRTFWVLSGRSEIATPLQSVLGSSTATEITVYVELPISDLVIETSTAVFRPFISIELADRNFNNKVVPGSAIVSWPYLKAKFHLESSRGGRTTSGVYFHWIVTCLAEKKI